MSVLITGSRGVLGSEIRGSFEGSYLAPTSSELDITDFDSIVKYFYENRPEIVLHLAAKTDVGWCEQLRNQKEVMRVNYEGTKNIKEACALFEVNKLIYISTDYVYQKEYGGHTEVDNPKPFCFYGFSKLAGESTLDASDLIIRTSFKPRSYFEKSRSFFGDSWTSSLYCDELAKILIDLINYKGIKEISGIINIGGYRRSYYDMAKKINPESEVSSKERVRLTYTYPNDVSMNLYKWEQLKKELYNNE